MKKQFRHSALCLMGILLAFLMVFYLFPTTVLAEFFESADQDESTEDKATGKEVFELTERREESVKHFRLEDGSVMAVQYAVPVHRADENGKWQDIDNRLSVQFNNISTPDARVRFARQITGNEVLFALQENNRRLSVMLNNTVQRTSGAITNTRTSWSEDATELDKKMTLDNLTSRVLYADALDGADLEYVVDSNNVKENIIVKTRKNAYTYTFTLHLDGMKAVLDEKGNICLTDAVTDELCYTIPAGYMYDANKAISHAVTYTLTALGNNNYTLTVTADAAWINAADRVFPVTIDPTVTYEHFSNGVSTAGIVSEYPDQNYGECACYLGNMEYAGKCSVLFRASPLAGIPQNAIITKASVVMTPMYEYFGPLTRWCVNVKRVLADWSSSTVTFNTCPTVGNEIEGFNILRDGMAYFEIDITELVSDWYISPSTNYGVLLTPEDTMTAYEYIYLANSGSHCNLYFAVTYRDATGYEDYFHYYQATAETAGIGLINAFNGNLVFLADILSTTDSLMPYTFSLTYNGSMANQSYTSVNAHTAFSATSTGLGFKLSTDDTIIAQGDHYIWADEDGTEHYFSPPQPGYAGQQSGYYYDEDGMKLSLAFDRENNVITGYTIKDDIGNKRHYSGNYLEYVEDVNGNRRNFVRDSSTHQLTSITLLPYGMQTAIEQLTFSYSNGKLSSALNVQTGLEAAFAYTNSSSVPGEQYLTGITYTYAVGASYTVSYTYDGNGHMTSATDNRAGQKAQFTYNNQGRVSGIQQWAKNSSNIFVAGAEATITYQNRQTVLCTPGKDNTLNTADDVYTYDVFDTAGRRLSSCVICDNINYGSAVYKFSESENVRNRNNITEISSLGGMAVNHLFNPGFEKLNVAPLNTDCPLDWICSSGVETHTASAYYGRSVQMNGTASVMQQCHLPNGQYTFSVKALWHHLGTSEYVRLRIYASDQTTVLAQTNCYGSGDSAADMSIWETLSLHFNLQNTNPADAIYVAIECYTISSHYAYIDAAMLESAHFTGAASIFDNGGFEDSGSGKTLFSTSGNYVSISTDEAHSGSAALKFEGARDRGLYAKTTIPLYTSATTDMGEPATFAICGWGKADSAQIFYVPANEGELRNGFIPDSIFELPPFGLLVVLHYATITSVSVHYIPFSQETEEWQYVCENINSAANSQGEYLPVTSIDVYCYYAYNVNTAYFDEISVIPESGTTSWYAYNSSGNLVKQSSTGKNAQFVTYQTGTVLIDTISKDNGFTYDRFLYDSQNRLITYRTWLNNTEYILSRYFYDDYGQTTQTRIVGGNNMYANWTTYANSCGGLNDQSAYFGKPLTETDASHNTKAYFYNAKGQLTGVCDDSNNGIIYQYNAYGQLTSACPAERIGDTLSPLSAGSITNTYNSKGNLTSIETEITEYSLIYDAFGRITEIQADGESLVSNTYDVSGKQISVEYGNGYSMTYLYDNIDRMIGICYNGSSSAAFTCTYGADGNVSSRRDLQNNLYTTYTYDVTGRMVNTQTRKVSSSQLVYAASKTYENDRVSTVTRYFAGNAGIAQTQETYTYDAKGELVSISNECFDDTITKDAIERLSGEYLAYSGITLQSKQYTYETYTIGGDGFTSDKVTTLYCSSNLANEATEYNYTYDNVGNITQITKGLYPSYPEETYHYTYDNKGQLVREDIYIAGDTNTSRTITYGYDDNGNRGYALTYAYSTGTLGAYVDFHLARYVSEYDEFEGEGPVWGDMLYKWDGAEIYYDEIGNPTQIDSDLLTWQGRQLMSYDLDVEDILISYTYDTDGIRLSKVVNENETHKYTTENGRILREVISSWSGKTDIRYYYDIQGLPAGLIVYTFNSSGTVAGSKTYYLQTNLQGDVVAVFGETGTKLCTYVYDAWGNILKEQRNGAEGILASQYNPFRYRGYYYDTETGLYYLQSRYYNPKWGRFLNADSISYLGIEDELLGYNLFIYCSNNPVMGFDPTGEWSWKAFWQGVGTTVAVTAVCTLVVAAITIATAGVGTALLGGAVAATVAGGLLAGTFATVDKAKDLGKEEMLDQEDIINVGKEAFFGSVEGAISYASGNVCSSKSMARVARVASRITNHLIFPLISASVEQGVDNKDYSYYQESIFKSNLPQAFWQIGKLALSI